MFEMLRAHQRIRHPLLFIIALGAVTALDASAMDMYLPGAVHVGRDLSASQSSIQITVFAFLFGLAVGQAVCGALIERYGRRLVLLSGVAIFVAASILAAIASSIEVLIAARLLQAFGAAAGLVAPRAIIGDLYREQDAAILLSALGQILAIMPVIAPLFGAFLIEALNWRAAFWALAILGAAVYAAVAVAVPESIEVSARAHFSWSNLPRIYGELLLSRPFALMTIANGAVLGSLFAYITGSPAVFLDKFSLTPVAYGWVLAGNAMLVLIAGGIGIVLLRHQSARTVIFTSLGLHVAGCVALLVAALMNASLVSILIAQGFALGVLGLSYGSLIAVAMTAAGRHAGIGSALLGVGQYLVGSILGFGVVPLGSGAVSMSIVMLVCALLGIGAYWLGLRTMGPEATEVTA